MSSSQVPQLSESMEDNCSNLIRFFRKPNAPFGHLGIKVEQTRHPTTNWSLGLGDVKVGKSNGTRWFNERVDSNALKKTIRPLTTNLCKWQGKHLSADTYEPLASGLPIDVDGTTTWIKFHKFAWVGGSDSWVIQLYDNSSAAPIPQPPPWDGAQSSEPVTIHPDLPRSMHSFVPSLAECPPGPSQHGSFTSLFRSEGGSEQPMSVDQSAELRPLQDNPDTITPTLPSISSFFP